MARVTARELARNLSAMLDKVELQREGITITRRNREVARMVPVKATMTALEAMDDLFGILSEEAAKDWLKDAHASQQTLTDSIKDPFTA